VTIAAVHSDNPFIGLRAFDGSESVRFFGRGEQTTELLERLYTSQFVAVLGYSGSGKSSLVFAGLIPKLLAGFLVQDRDGWFIAQMRPGDNPLRNLANAFTAAFTGTTASSTNDYHSLLETSDFRTLTATLAQALTRSDSNLLILVDQFEELFRYRAANILAGSTSHDSAGVFVDAVLHLAAQREAPIYVVLTMRADFVGDCAFYPGLAETISRSVFLIPRMKKPELMEAIVGPIRLAGGRISDAAIERLWSDGADHPDQLPILQHALMRIWTQWQAHSSWRSCIEVEQYEAVGGLHHALDNHLEATFMELRDRQREIAEKTFKCLCQQDANNTTVRRPTRLADICAVTETDLQSVIEVIDTFRRPGRSFLMPLDQPLSPGTVIDISHESLIRNWDRLRAWVREETNAANMYRRIVEAAVRHGGLQGGLWRDPDLSTALRWRESVNPTAVWAARYDAAPFDEAMRFLDESLAWSNNENAYRHQQQRARVRSGVGMGFIAGTIAGALLSWIFL
jgi:hypothetical protein